jgi:ABC-2 type transport system ATP-binding protein
MIRVDALRKQYGDLLAVDDVSFVAEAGSIFGLLGPNGAGKTTTIGCISGLLPPSAGHVSIAGHDVVTDGPASREKLGVVPQELALYEDLSARDNLSYWGSAYGMGGAPLKLRVQEVLEVVGLADRATARRTDRRGRPAEPRADPRSRAGASEGRHVRHLHDALHGGGAEPL